MISDPSDKASIPEEPSAADPHDHPAPQVTTNPTSHLASFASFVALVEHGINLCEVRHSWEKAVFKNLEKRKKWYLDAVESAKISLAMTRRDAVDIVTRVNAASGDIINITLPWQGEVKKEVYDTENIRRGPTTPPSTVISAMPSSACPAHVPSPPGPTIVAPKSTLIPTSLTLAPCSTTVVNHCISAAPLVHTPTYPSSPLVALAPESTLGAGLPRPAFLTPTINPRIPTKLSAIVPPSANVHQHQELLQRYEEKMNAAKGTENGTLDWSMIPWPVLISQFPRNDSSHSATAFPANLQAFISSYSQWKELSVEQTSTVMLSDWVLILSKMKPNTSKRTKRTIDRLISHLRTFSK